MQFIGHVAYMENTALLGKCRYISTFKIFNLKKNTRKAYKNYVRTFELADGLGIEWHLQ